MNLLEYLYKTYGQKRVDDILYYLPADKNYQILKQHLELTEYTEENLSHYKSLVISKLEDKIADKLFLYDFSNIIANTDFKFKEYNTIITYGTFDLFHIGHLKLLERLSKMCNNLIVAVSTDEFNALKGKKCVIPFEQRAAIVAGCKYVTKVIPETCWEQKEKDIEKYNVDAFVMGDDWKGKFDFLKEKCEVVYLPRAPDISTTELKSVLKR